MQGCSEYKYICKGNKGIIKDDKLQTLEISFSIPSGVTTIGGGVQRTPKCWQPRHCAGSRLSRKYKDGLGAHIGEGVATWIKAGIHLQQLDSTQDTQKPSSEIGFENWVWALFGPPNLSVGLRVCLYFITL